MMMHDDDDDLTLPFRLAFCLVASVQDVVDIAPDSRSMEEMVQDEKEAKVDDDEDDDDFDAECDGEDSEDSL